MQTKCTLEMCMKTPLTVFIKDPGLKGDNSLNCLCKVLAISSGTNAAGQAEDLCKTPGVAGEMYLLGID